MKLIRVRIILLITIVRLIFLSHLPKSFGNEDSGDDYYYDDENSQNNTQDNASQEEYEGYEDEQAIQRESMEMEVGGDGSFFEPEPEQEFMYGFIRNSGGGLIKINELLVNEEYLNYTRDRYDCLKLEDLIVPIVEYVEEEEPEISIEEQLAQMKNKLNKAIKGVMQAIDGKDGSSEENNEPSPDDKSQNTTESNNTTNADSKKRLTFREKQALRMKERQEKEAQRELVKPKYRLGADCETLICGACKAIVEEFGYAVAKAVPDRNIKYIDQITEGFCFTKQISLKYREIVSDLCKTFDKDELGYKEAMIQSYEEHPDWSTIGSLTSILDKQEKVCLQVGACQPEYFEFQREPLHEKQEQWNSSCFVCQAFAKNLEERIHLSRFLTEVTIVPLVAQTCDRLRLPGEYDELCRKLTKGKLLDDIAWLAKVHEESIVKKAKAELRFPDKLCEEIDWCEPWIDPEQLKEKEIRKQLEPVYF